MEESLLAPVVQLRNELQMLRVGLEYDRLPRLRDEYEKRHRERVAAQRSLLQRLLQPGHALSPRLGRHVVVEVDSLGPERLTARHCLNLGIGHVLDGLLACHTRDELLQYQKIEALVILEGVDQVLKQRAELDGAVLLGEVAAKGGESAEPQRHVLTVVLEFLPPFRELLDDHEC